MCPQGPFYTAGAGESNNEDRLHQYPQREGISLFLLYQVNCFELTERKMTAENLGVHFEKNEFLETIEQVPFSVNTKSK